MDLSQVTLTQMRYAVAVADHESFRVAAERSHVSQSGLSMQIHKLKELLGVVLFDRSKKPLLTTAAGARAITQMRAVLRETERLGKAVADQDEPSGPFRLGVIPTLSASTVPLFLRGFLERYPRVELSIEELRTDEMITRLRADTLDAGIAATPLAEGGLSEIAVAVEPMLAYLPPRDPLLRRAHVTQTALAERSLWVMPEGHCFRSQVLAYCQADRARSAAPARFESGSFATLIRLVDAGMGATVLPALVAQELPVAVQRARVRPLRPLPAREIGVVTSRTQLHAATTAALAQALRTALAAALGAQRGTVLDPRG